MHTFKIYVYSHKHAQNVKYIAIHVVVEPYLIIN